jgi:hypothetical protein
MGGTYRFRRTAMPQDAITLLDEDHQRVELLFTEYQSTTAERSRTTWPRSSAWS